MPDDFARVARKVDALSADLSGRGLRTIVSGVARDAKDDVRDAVGRDIGADRQMRNWGRIRFDARYDITSDSTAVIEPRPAGPWKVLDQGRRGGHKIPKGRRQSKVYNTPWGLRTATQDRPWVGSSSRGKGTWTSAVRVMERRTPERVHRHTRTVIGRHFGGR